MENDKKYVLGEIPHNRIKSNNIFMIPRIRIPAKIANGNVAIRKNIYNTLNWYNYQFRGQDVVFNNFVYRKYNKSLFIEVPIYYYRKRLSVKNLI